MTGHYGRTRDAHSLAVIKFMIVTCKKVPSHQNCYRYSQGKDSLGSSSSSTSKIKQSKRQVSKETDHVHYTDPCAKFNIRDLYGLRWGCLGFNMSYAARDCLQQTRSALAALLRWCCKAEVISDLRIRSDCIFVSNATMYREAGVCRVVWNFTTAFPRP